MSELTSDSLLSYDARFENFFFHSLNSVFVDRNVNERQHVSEISTLILTSDRFHQEQQNCYVPFFRNIISISVFYPLHKLTSCLFSSYLIH
jgi:hypothetical protein